MRHSVPLLLFCAIAAMAAEERPIRTVHFMSADGKTELIGYLFEPEARGAHPAVVMLHGRAGAYSSRAKGTYTSATLSKRHKFWGHYWAQRGYVALMVDSFGPRGYWEGFGKGSYDERPSEVSEQTVRPLDAYGALAYLRKRRDVIAGRIGLQGWSNGAMTTLVTMSSQSPGIESPTPASGFRAALAFYPGCGMDAIKGNYHNYAPLQMFTGSADEEVSPKRCAAWEKHAEGLGNPIHLLEFEGAQHGFDDPSKSKQDIPANAAATHESIARSERFFAQHLR